MVIDAHNHPYWKGHDGKKILASMDACGIDVTWLHSWEPWPGEWGRGPGIFDPPFTEGMTLEAVMTAASEDRSRLVPFYAPDPRDRDAERKLRDAKKSGVRGYGEWKCCLPFDDPACLALFRICGDLRFPVVFHFDPRHLPPARQDPEHRMRHWYGGDFGNLEMTLRMCSETIFVGHGPGFWREISGDSDERKETYPEGPVTPGGRLPDFLRRFPNLHADLSGHSGYLGISRDRELGIRFLEEFSDRLLYGRDDFHNKHLEYLRSLSLSVEVLERILSGNALRLVPLSTQLPTRS